MLQIPNTHRHTFASPHTPHTHGSDGPNRACRLEQERMRRRRYNPVLFTQQPNARARTRENDLRAIIPHHTRSTLKLYRLGSGLYLLACMHYGRSAKQHSVIFSNSEPRDGVHSTMCDLPPHTHTHKLRTNIELT